MKIIKTLFYDDGYLGNTKIECNCGFEFEKKTAAVDDVIECPKCHRKGVIHSKLEVWIQCLDDYFTTQ